MWGLLFFSNLFINRLLGVLLKDCYDSSSALGCGQQSAQREESQAAASECQAQPLARAGRRMRSEASRAAEASSAVRPSGQPRERERERVASVSPRRSELV